jgi:gamma-glutamyltranspeptidase/glutathione hydrolase
MGERASLSTTPGAPDDKDPKLPSVYARAIAVDGRDAQTAAAISGGRGGDTAHISVIDRHHNLASAMPSGGWLQSSPVIPEVGFALGTRAQMMWLDPGLPNSLLPRKRPRTTLSPTLVLSDDGRPLLGFGSPGGDAQDQWGLQFFLSHVACGLSPEVSVARPTFQSLHVASSFWPRERRPGVLQVEGDLSSEVVRELTALEHIVEIVPERSQGWTCAVRRDPERGHLSAAASPRGDRGWALAR